MARIDPKQHPICFEQPRLLALSAWLPHVPFGMYLIDILRPASIVELGTRKGVSYSAFCQAVETLGLKACCVAVDSWHGDAHTGAYGGATLRQLRLHHDPRYGSFSRLLQSAFDDAAVGFPEGSIDLLHVDGLHTYEAVRHDYETWLPKLSPRSVVLFHDIEERRDDFGVWRLWEELSGRHPSFAFRHGHGLGVLGVGVELPDEVDGLLHLQQAQANELRRFFEQQGRRAAVLVVAAIATGLPGRIAAAVQQLTQKRKVSSTTRS